MRYRKLMLTHSLAITALVLGVTEGADAGSSNVEHELVVYSLKSYGTYGSPNWKPTIVPWFTNMDPYQDFWSSMYNCTGTECAHSYSARYENSAVSVNQMATDSATQTNRGWSGSDFVVFYGHNTMIQPRWQEEFDLWRYNAEFYTWYHFNVPDWSAWGTSSEHYTYHRYRVYDASSSNAYAVFYAYNPFTSILIGKDFPKTGDWYTENTWNQGMADTRQNHFAGELEWILADGCNAVTVANPAGTTALQLGVSAWDKSWDGLHMVMGHYYETDTSRLPNLGGYASDLKFGGYVQPAYFDRHSCSPPDGKEAGYCQPSAIEIQPSLCTPPLCWTIYMNSDRWNPNEMSDVTGDYRYKTKWNVAQ